MESNKIYWKTVLELIHKGELTGNIIVDFNNEIISWQDAMVLGGNGFEVSQDLIDYDDENIDYSDIPPITEEDIESGRLQWICRAEVPIRKEIDEWMRTEKIDVNQLFADLVENFYQTMKNINKHAAL